MLKVLECQADQTVRVQYYHGVQITVVMVSIDEAISQCTLSTINGTMMGWR